MTHDPQQDTPTFDVELVRALVANQFPHWAQLEIQPVTPGGWDNRTFRLGDDMLVRLPSGPSYASQVEKEQEWLPYLAGQLPLPIPAPLAKGMPDEAYPWAWSVYRWLPGRPLGQSSELDMRRIACQLAGFLKALQSLDTTGGPEAGTQNFHRGGPLRTYDAQTQRALARLEGEIDVRLAKKLWQKALSTHWQRPPVWVHGDVAPSNLLVLDGVLCGVIDFGGLAVGDPACDLAIAWATFEGEVREIFLSELDLDAGTVARAQGWALWKALIVLSGLDPNQRQKSQSEKVISDLLESK